jgi:hypothetical protein
MRSDPDSFVSGLFAGAAAVGCAWMIVLGLVIPTVVCGGILVYTFLAERY